MMTIWKAMKATMTFTDKMTVYLGNRRVDLMHLGRAHTAGDIVACIGLRVMGRGRARVGLPAGARGSEHHNAEQQPHQAQDQRRPVFQQQFRRRKSRRPHIKPGLALQALDDVRRMLARASVKRKRFEWIDARAAQAKANVGSSWTASRKREIASSSRN